MANLNFTPENGQRVMVYMNGQKRLGYMMGVRKDTTTGDVVLYRLRLDGDKKWSTWKPENVGLVPKIRVGDWVRHKMPAGPDNLGEGAVTKVSEDGTQVHFHPRKRRDPVMVLATHLIFCSHGAESLKQIKAEKLAYEKLKAEEAAAKAEAESE